MEVHKHTRTRCMQNCKYRNLTKINTASIRIRAKKRSGSGDAFVCKIEHKSNKDKLASALIHKKDWRVTDIALPRTVVLYLTKIQKEKEKGGVIASTNIISIYNEARILFVKIMKKENSVII